jgi:hypothetical protein
MGSEYLESLKQNNALMSTLVAHIEGLKTELEVSRDRIKELENELEEYRSTGSYCINRRQFGFYFMSVTNRELDDETWVKFKETFKFTYEHHLNEEVYTWIQKIENGTS